MPHYRVLYKGRDRAVWLEKRGGTLGASEAAPVCGASRFSSPLGVYVEKVSGALPFDSPITRFGRIYEQEIAQDFREATGRKVKLDGRLIASRRRPWQSCTLDARQWSDEHEGPGLAELKTSLYGWDASGIPLEYWIQIQHQFAVTGFSWGSAVMFNRTNCETVHKDVYPDHAFIRRLTLRESQFWHRCVIPGIPPEVEDDDDTEATRKALLRMYPTGDPGKIVALGTKIMQARDRRTFAKENLASYTRIKKATENRIKAAIGSADGGVFPNGSGFTFKANKNGVRSLLEKERM